MDKIALSLGSNMGDTYAHLEQARTLLLEEGLSIVGASKELQTKAWGIEDQSDFLNQVLLIEFNEEYEGERDPYTLLSICQNVEKKMQRIMEGDPKYIKWGPRIIDIDILYYRDIELHDPKLTIPHHTVQKDYIKELVADALVTKA